MFDVYNRGRRSNKSRCLKSFISPTNQLTLSYSLLLHCCICITKTVVNNKPYRGKGRGFQIISDSYQLYNHRRMCCCVVGHVKSNFTFRIIDLSFGYMGRSRLSIECITPSVPTWVDSNKQTKNYYKIHAADVQHACASLHLFFISVYSL